MAIGAQDYIDQMLVQKYAEMQVDNHDMQESLIPPEEVMNAMSYNSYNLRNYIGLSRRLSVACYGINTKNARYTASELS